MKLKRFSFAALFTMLLCICANAQQSDYYVKHGADVKVTHSTHYPKAVGIYGTQIQSQILHNIASALVLLLRKVFRCVVSSDLLCVRAFIFKLIIYISSNLWQQSPRRYFPSTTLEWR